MILRRNITSMVLSAALIASLFASYSIAAPETNAMTQSGGYVVQDDFDLETLGSVPANYTVTAGSGTSATVSNEASSSVPNSLKLYDNNSSGRVTAARTFPATASPVIEMDIKSPGEWLDIQFYSGSSFAARIYMKTDGKLSYYHQAVYTNLADYNKSGWNALKLVFNGANKTFDVVLDGNTVASAVPYYTSTAGSLDRIILGTGASAAGTGGVFVDNVKVWDDTIAPPPDPEPDPYPAPDPDPDSGADDAIAPLRTFHVSTIADLQTRINDAIAGDEIVLADGTYTLTQEIVVPGKNGSADHPIVIRAETVGGVTITGSATVRGFNISNSSYVIVKGFRFTHGVSSARGMQVWSSNHIRITRNHFQLNDGGVTNHWLVIAGTDSNYNRVDRNRFEHKTSVNNFLAVYGTTAGGDYAMPLYTLIDHNYFYDTPELSGKSDGTEAIRIGDSNRGPIPSYTVIEHNLFEKLEGDMPSDGSEAVSVKASNVTVRYNTFRDNKNALVFRHGNNSSAEGNFFLDTEGGIRFYGDNMRIFNNYFANNTGTGVRAPIYIESGKTEHDTGKGTDANRPNGGIVAFNTLVNNTGENIHIGASANPLPPIHIKVGNNLITGSTGKLFLVQTSLDYITFEGNLVYPTGTATIGDVTTGYIQADPLLSLSSGLYRIAGNSPAVDSAVNESSYNVTADMDGHSRSSADIGADEYDAGSGGVNNHPLTTSDVGPYAP